MDRGAWQATVHATMGSQRVRHEWAANEFQNSSCNLGSSKTLKNVPFSPLRYRNNVLNVSTHLCNSIQLTFIYFYIHLTIEQHRGVLTLCIESPGISYARPPNRQFLHFPDFPFLGPKWLGKICSLCLGKIFKMVFICTSNAYPKVFLFHQTPGYQRISSNG